MAAGTRDFAAEGRNGRIAALGFGEEAETVNGRTGRFMSVVS
jgi:hypothetical protein